MLLHGNRFTYPYLKLKKVTILEAKSSRLSARCQPSGYLCLSKQTLLFLKPTIQNFRLGVSQVATYASQNKRYLDLRLGVSQVATYASQDKRY